VDLHISGLRANHLLNVDANACRMLIGTFRLHFIGQRKGPSSRGDCQYSGLCRETISRPPVLGIENQ